MAVSGPMKTAAEDLKKVGGISKNDKAEGAQSIGIPGVPGGGVMGWAGEGSHIIDCAKEHK